MLPQINILVEFQGEQQHNIFLPANTEKVVFVVDDDGYVAIKEITFHK